MNHRKLPVKRLCLFLGGPLDGEREMVADAQDRYHVAEGSYHRGSRGGRPANLFYFEDIAGMPRSA